ncbi:MAG: hypothetical protein ACYC96_15215 [Fimbriimonadaceae bacterium]
MRRVFDPNYRLTPRMWCQIVLACAGWTLGMAVVTLQYVRPQSGAEVGFALGWFMFSLALSNFGDLLVGQPVTALEVSRDRVACGIAGICAGAAVCLQVANVFLRHEHWMPIAIGALLLPLFTLRPRQWSRDLQRQAEIIPHPCGGVVGAPPIAR